ncbi:hypothetical protein EJ08DRAFT_652000 [Tothia fuscella]|uniref:Chromosome condensation protein n=1 Tax=Tothia fuscella TaxID=1048955 RepID=A0A9P4NKV0_9PEZI|nr:hypothetical protein EJ08DRAFT_652000 [Tothia fuscella]
MQKMGVERVCAGEERLIPLCHDDLELIKMLPDPNIRDGDSDALFAANLFIRSFSSRFPLLLPLDFRENRLPAMADNNSSSSHTDTPTPSFPGSECNSKRASHGSASTRPQSQDSILHSPIFSQKSMASLIESATPPPAVKFFDESTIRRQTSMDDYTRERKHTTWPMPEHRFIPGISPLNESQTPQQKRHTQHFPLPDEESPTIDDFPGVPPSPVKTRSAAPTPSKPPKTAFPSYQRSQSDLIQTRRSSKRFTRIRQRMSEKDMGTEKKKQKKKAAPLRASQQLPMGNTTDVSASSPGSRNKENATALPNYTYNVENLEEQLAVAQQLSTTNSSLANTNPEGHARLSKIATELYTISYLILFSILGTLGRLGIQWLAFYPGAPVVTPVLWANFAGSMVMGFLSTDRKLFREEWGPHSTVAPSLSPKAPAHEEDPVDGVAAHGKVKKTIPLYIGLATGFCGSLTSFSSFMRDVFLSLSNNLPTPSYHTYPSGFDIPSMTTTIHRNGGFSFLATIAVLLLTICLALGGLHAGNHLANLSHPYTPILPFSIIRKVLDRIFVFVAFGSWLVVLLLCIFPQGANWRGQALFACGFAPLGCLVRFYISFYLNPFSGTFPLGTFAVNIFGTAVEGMSYDLQHVQFGGRGVLSCEVLQGVMDGFCGCLTTVSTWVSELNTFNKKSQAYFYGGTSVISGLSILVMIMGSVRWSIGFTEISCTI